MSNLDDDDGIKQFFNKVANNYNISYDESDWQKMEKMLDAENARAAAVRSTRWKVAAIGFGALSLFLMIYFFVSPSYTSSSVSRDTEIQESPKTNDLKNDKEAMDHQIKADSSLKENTERIASSQKRKDDSAISDTSVRSVKNYTRKPASRPPQSKALNKSPLQKDVDTTDPENEKVVSEMKSSENLELSDQTAITYPEKSNALDSSVVLRKNERKDVATLDSSASRTPQKIEEQLPSKTAVGVLTAPVISKDSVEIANEIVEPKSIDESPVDDKELEKEDTGLAYSRWSISLAIAPDFSSTELFKQASAGSAFGITIQYDVSRRVTLQTGALLTSKKYWNKGNEYSSIRPGYWVARTNGVIPERIDGGCSVLEIPLSLRYTVLNIKKSRIYASAGASSYIMLSEFYDFTFKDPNPNATEKYKSSETENYILGIGGVSVAYERMIHPKLSIGIEPYAKIPYAKIGWAKLPLYSVGAYVTLRYRMLK